MSKTYLDLQGLKAYNDQIKEWIEGKLSKSGLSALSITNVFNQEYEETTASNPNNDEHYSTYDKLYADILFNLNCDAYTLWAIKDAVYLTISRYSKQQCKHTVLNDQMGSDDRLTMYCWKVTNGETDPLYWQYFYTAEEYNNDVNYLWDIDPVIALPRHPNEMYLYEGAVLENNYATNLHMLTQDNLCVSDIWSISDGIERVPERDVNSYYINILSTNPVEKYMNDDDWHGGEVPMSFNKQDFMHWVSDKSIVQRGQKDIEGEKIDLYAYRSYAEDYPITPVKLADCEVLLPIKLAVKYYGDDANGLGHLWKKLNDLEMDDLQYLTKITLKCPYNSNEILARLYKQRHQHDYICRDWKNIIYADILAGSNVRGKSYRVSDIEGSGMLYTYIHLGLCDEASIKAGNYTGMPVYKVRMKSYKSRAQNFDSYSQYCRQVIITIIQ